MAMKRLSVVVLIAVLGSIAPRDVRAKWHDHSDELPGMSHDSTGIIIAGITVGVLLLGLIVYLVVREDPKQENVGDDLPEAGSGAFVLLPPTTKPRAVPTKNGLVWSRLSGIGPTRGVWQVPCPPGIRPLTEQKPPFRTSRSAAKPFPCPLLMAPRLQGTASTYPRLQFTNTHARGGA